MLEAIQEQDVIQAATAPDARERLVRRFARVRGRSVALAAPLTAGGPVVQSMPDASPTNGTWRTPPGSSRRSCCAARRAATGRSTRASATCSTRTTTPSATRHPRPQRGLLSRPTVAEVYRLPRRTSTSRCAALLDVDDASCARLEPLIELGLNHEQQHQELMLTDIKHALRCNPLRPAYRRGRQPCRTRDRAPLRWLELPGRPASRSATTGDGFAFDNETPRHRVFLAAVPSSPSRPGDQRRVSRVHRRRRLRRGPSSGCPTAGTAVQAQRWDAPLYWEPRRRATGERSRCTAMRRVDAAEPVCHVSYYEADAYRPLGRRAPADRGRVGDRGAPRCRIDGQLRSTSGAAIPLPHRTPTAPAQMFGDVWEWTRSPYVAYPGYRPPAGALGEYNGKFMCNQMVLRGGSCATPRGPHPRRPTATSSRPTPAGSSPASGWRRTFEWDSVAVRHVWLEQPAGTTAMTIFPLQHHWRPVCR